MAAARASLLEVLTPEAYAHLDRLNDAHPRGLPGASSTSTGCPATRSASARRAASRSRRSKIVDYETFKAQPGRRADRSSPGSAT